MDNSTTYQRRTSLTTAAFDTIVYGNPLPDMLSKDLQCTDKALSHFLDSEECLNQLKLGEKLANFQSKVRAQRHAADALETLHYVTDNKRNPMAQRLAATELLAYAGVHPKPHPPSSSTNPSQSPQKSPPSATAGPICPHPARTARTPSHPFPPKKSKTKNGKSKIESPTT